MFKKKNIVYVGGTFDLFHIVHLNILKRAKRLGEKLVVGVKTDKVVLKHKNKLPVIPFEQRIAIVKSIEYVDIAVPIKSTDESKLLEKICPDIAIKGDNDEARIEVVKWMEENGRKFILLPCTKRISTTKIIKKINESIRRT